MTSTIRLLRWIAVIDPLDQQQKWETSLPKRLKNKIEKDWWILYAKRERDRVILVLHYRVKNMDIIWIYTMTTSSRIFVLKRIWLATSVAMNGFVNIFAGRYIDDLFYLPPIIIIRLEMSPFVPFFRIVIDPNSSDEPPILLLYSFRLYLEYLRINLQPLLSSIRKLITYIFSSGKSIFSFWYQIFFLRGCTTSFHRS